MPIAEKDNLRKSISACWNTGSLSSDALRTSVEVEFEISREGKLKPSSIKLASSSSSSENATKQAFEAARRAILRCGARGFDLPVENYAHWKSIIMTFDPVEMRLD